MSDRMKDVETQVVSNGTLKWVLHYLDVFKNVKSNVLQLGCRPKQ